MKRRLITTILSCILSVAMVVPAWAEEITEEAVATQESVDIETETEDADDTQLSEDATVVMEDAADITVEETLNRLKSMADRYRCWPYYIYEDS